MFIFFLCMQVLNACARRKHWEGAFWVLQQLKQQHLQPSTTTYGLVMEVIKIRELILVSGFCITYGFVIAAFL